MGRNLKPRGTALLPGGRTVRSGDRAKPPAPLAPKWGGGGYQHRGSRYDVIHRHATPETPGTAKAFPASVHPDVVAMLTLGGKRTPYGHQAEAARLALDEDQNVALVTPTASGKTVSFLAPVLTILARDRSAVALMIYPMNALATDQLKNLQELGFQPVDKKPGIYVATIGGAPIVAGVMNGDATEAQRRIIREDARLIISNHAALHASILQQAQRSYSDGSSWRRVVRNLRVLVLDEAHSYNGVQGTNAALAFRRLFALVESFGAPVPKVILATATIGNPLEHAESLTGLQNWGLIDRSGARTYQRSYQVVLPAEHPKGGRWAASVIAQEIALDQVARHKRVLVFCPSRAGTERMADKINEALGRKAAIAFNSSIPAAQKREFLAEILAGNVQVVATTSALELGVDIGAMDTVIVMGHPGDHASFNQRAGRVGRTGPGDVFLILDENQHPINTYLEGNPEAISWDPECRTVYPANKIIGRRHAACSMLETGDAEAVRRWFPKISAKDVKVALEAPGSPYDGISMVGLGNFGQFKAVEPTGRPIQELGGQDALLYWYEGAILRNAMGEFFRVVELDTQRMIAETEPANLRSGYRSYTSPRITDTQVALPGTEVILDHLTLPITGLESAVAADYDVTRQTVGYTEYSSTPTASDPEGTYSPLSGRTNPAIGLITRGVSFTLGKDTALYEFVRDRAGATKVLADALGLTVTLMVQARPGDVPVDVKLSATGLHFLVYDMADGGMGMAEAIVHRLDRWLMAAGRALTNCRCQLRGCPRCSLAASVTGRPRAELAELMVALGRSKKA